MGYRLQRYSVVLENTPAKLTNTVDEALEDGWVVNGAPVLVPKMDGKSMLLQSLVKGVSEEPRFA